MNTMLNNINNMPNNLNNILDKSNKDSNYNKDSNKIDIFDTAKYLPNGALHFKHDPETGLKAIIAVHSTALGPALGGCRFKEYESTEDAIIDAMRLARGMSYKAAVTNLPLGGGKAVIIKPKEIKNKKAFFGKFGLFVEQLGGQYITAMDMGTSLEEMDIIAKHTKYVASLTAKNTISNGDPSPYTAYGTLKGIEAAVKHKLNKDSVKDLKIAIQGVGHVGLDLATRLHKQGAKLYVTDINEESLKHCEKEFKATIVDGSEIYKLDCDVFSPCAVGAILNHDTVEQIKAPIIAGSANNQLATKDISSLLHKKNILYTPDYVINAGGVAFAYALYANISEKIVFQQIENIYNSLLDIFEKSSQNNMPTDDISDEIAKQKIRSAQAKLDNGIY